MTELNSQQLAILRHQKGDAIVAATPGSGKTTTVVHFIAELIGRGISPERICATTFSKEAAAEMNKRLSLLAGNTTAHVSTLHSLGLEIVKSNPLYAGWDVDGANSWADVSLSQILGYRGLKSRFQLKEISMFIATCKNRLLDAATIEEEYRIIEADYKSDRWSRLGIGNPPHPDFIKAYVQYEGQRNAEKTITFDDMIFMAVRCLADDNFNLRVEWQKRYEWVIVDEFQDTNYAEYELVKILAAKSNLMVIGDDDQSVYSFRSASPELLIYFKQMHNATQYKIDNNYRSGREIVKYANQLIDKNTDRIKKQIQPVRNTPGTVYLWTCGDTDDEADRITKFTQDTRKSDITPLHEYAVLYRTNAYSQAFEDAFTKAKLPYVVFTSHNFSARREIKGMLGYLRAAYNPSDFDAWKACANAPFRYLGKPFFEKWDKIAGKDRNYKAALTMAADGQNQIASAREVVECVNLARSYPPAEAMRLIDKRAKFCAWVATTDGAAEVDNDRVGNVLRLIDTASKSPTLEHFMGYLQKAEKKPKKKKDTTNHVQVMTAHRSKGLEFKYVFVVGLTRGLMPHPKSTNLEEERRLCYVAMTRAKDHLIISYPMVAFNNSIGGPSQFLYEAGLIEQPDDQPEIDEEGEDIVDWVTKQQS